MSKTVDLELKKAFKELQQKMLETTQQLKVADARIEVLKQGMRHTQLTGKELSSMPPDTKMYQGVGRMFVLTDVNEIKTSLDKKHESYSQKIKQLENNKMYLERNLKDSENNLREMIQQRKEAGDTN
ncbi:prefoldin subunit 1 [Schistocerca americana]|uniref:prefoldin subunit 1 n=1 Tax=Schistocerca americana TaxID=7009 RepID=UPI001F4FA16F|nr:prefoldin subunit 1 [Schistocerca americana]XP_047098823.1 prefoldin subunit 1 [Schistocerca piceifrons]XP_049767256.1 prefoldin subunit 1 [Schistocerca cancellata]XP_049793471.1 prefoldin subunit 1 [Schistocerca nitens]XP_049840523.1 prefoldin subunit 1 [Schistocerca gregaria]